MNDNQAFWQRFAKQYAGCMHASRSLYRTICDTIRPKLNKHMVVLELACGSGQLSFELAPAVHLWEATDFSSNMIAQARKVQPRPTGLHFAVQDATRLPYATASFDAVVIANALHIMPDPERAMSEIHRVLKPNGTLFAPTFIHGGGVGFRARMGLMKLIGFRVYSSWTAEEFADFLDRQGFAVRRKAVLADRLMPLCYAEAVPRP